MAPSFFLILLGCMATSLVVVGLLAIGKKNSLKSSHDFAHIKLFVIILLLIFLTVALSNLLSGSSTHSFTTKISILFLIINSILTLIIYTSNTQKDSSGKIYFFIPTLLSLSLANILSGNLLIKIFTSISWLILFGALLFFTTKGGKKVELSLKLLFSCFILIICLALLCLFSPTGIISSSSLNINWSLFPVLISGLCLAGIAPFHFSSIDCADGSPEACAFLLLTNGPIQGAMLIAATKHIWASAILTTSINNLLFFIIASGMIIIWLRSIDQRKIRRTVTYIAASGGHLFSLAFLYLAATDSQNRLFYTIIFSFLSLSLFSLYSSVAMMKPLVNPRQTWEDLSGFGRSHHEASFCFMVAAATLAGVPGSAGYFLRLQLIHPMQHSIYFKIILFLSIALGIACILRIFVFLYSKEENQNRAQYPQKQPSVFLIVSTIILLILGLLPFFE